MVIADNEISAPKSPKKSNYWKKPGLDVPVLVVGTKSWPAHSDAQTPKPKNHVENVAVPAYAFPPGSGPYPNGENPKPVSPVAAGQVQAESGAEGSNEAKLVQAESVPEGSHEAKRGRRERVHWTEGEHKLFLEGLEKHGRGRWKAISKEFVVTKTPTQIASHAQKYFIHQNVKDTKRKKRRSIHDTTLNKNDTSVTAPMEQHENSQDTATSRQMQLVLLCPIGSTLPDMNKFEKMCNLFNLLIKEL